MFKIGDPGGPGRPKKADEDKKKVALRRDISLLLADQISSDFIEIIVDRLLSKDVRYGFKVLELLLKRVPETKPRRELISPRVMEVLHQYCKPEEMDLLEMKDGLKEGKR